MSNTMRSLQVQVWLRSLAILLLVLSSGYQLVSAQTGRAIGIDEKHAAGNNAANSERSKPATETPIARPELEKSDKPNVTGGTVEDRVRALEEELKSQNERLVEMSRIVTNQQRLIERLSSGTPRSSGDVAAALPLNPGTAATPPSLAKAIAPTKADSEDGPLTVRIGSASLTPVGFLDFTTVFRSTNGGSGIGTNFGSIPFGNTTQGNLSELRLSAQNARIGFRVDAKAFGANVIGYFESDFLGNNPGNVSVSSNSDTNRLRLYWVDVRKNKFEFLGGQSWSMLTPGRKGISPIPSNLFFTQNIDVNYQAGLVWARQPQFRMLYHPSDRLTLGLSLENPEQYIGGSAGGGAVTLPSGLATAYGTELDSGASTLSVPNLLPDVVAKIAYDSKVGTRDFHIEAAGLVRQFKVFNPGNLQHFNATGGGGSVNVNFEFVKNVRFLSNNYLSDGGGRYIFGQAPDLIAKGDGSLSLVHAASTVTGFEATIKQKTPKVGNTPAENKQKELLLYGYYGGIYIGRNAAVDPANGRFVGYGYSGSPAGQNRAIQEITLGFSQTFWKDPKYGELKFMGQYSYLLRKPWFVAVGGVTDAHTNMVFLNLRYQLPGKAPDPK